METPGLHVPRLQMYVTRGGDTVTVRGIGEIDLNARTEVAHAVDDALASECPNIVVDLAGVPFMDSTGVHGVARLYERASTAGRRVRVVGASPLIGRVLGLSGLGELLAGNDDHAA